MTTRLLMLPAVLAGLFALSGCFGPEMTPASEEPQVTQQPNLPVAPAPRAKVEGRVKPWGELLVGTWKAVTWDGRPLPAEWEITFEFTKDGKFTMRGSTPKHPRWVQTGTYQFNDTTVRITTPANADEPEESWEVTIEALSDAELSTATGTLKERERMVFKRVGKK